VVELVDVFVTHCSNVSVAHVVADHCAIFDSTKPLSLLLRVRDLVCAINNRFSRPDTGSLMNSEPLSERKAADEKRKLAQDRPRHRLQVRLRDRAADDLPLGDFVNGVDVIHTFDTVLISFVHRVDSEIARLAAWLWLAPFADRHLYGACWCRHPALAVAPALSHVVNVRDRTVANCSYSECCRSAIHVPGCSALPVHSSSHARRPLSLAIPNRPA